MADAVGAVAGLILDRRIPPWIEVDDVIGGREIQPRAARPQADEEQVALPRLEGCDPLFALRGWSSAVEILMGDTARQKRLAHAFELADELAEDQRLMFVADEVVDEVEERLELGAGQRCGGIDKAGEATGPAQLGDFGENGFP